MITENNRAYVASNLKKQAKARVGKMLVHHAQN